MAQKMPEYLSMLAGRERFAAMNIDTGTLGFADIDSVKREFSNSVEIKCEMRTLFVLSLLTLTVTSATTSIAQSLPAMERVGFGVALAETTRDACYYAPDVLVALNKQAVRFSETAPALWHRVMDVSRKNAQAMGSFARGLDPTIDDCQAAGFGICDALVYHVMLLGPNPVVLQEMQRLGKRGGRLTTDEELQANEILEDDL